MESLGRLEGEDFFFFFFLCYELLGLNFLGWMLHRETSRGPATDWLPLGLSSPRGGPAWLWPHSTRFWAFSVSFNLSSLLFFIFSVA